jgi:hypothetical protein
MSFLAPGILTSSLAIFIQQLTWLIPYAIVLLAAGLLSLVTYMIWQRLNWRCYVLPDEIAQSSHDEPMK